MNQLEALQTMTVVVADTGDFEEIRKYRPADATTNPSLILTAAQKPECQFLIEEALSHGRRVGKSRTDVLSHALDKVSVNFGVEIVKIIPGRVSTEVDSRLSFDTLGSIQKSRHLISLYEAAGVPRERVLIKLASTWEGIQAARHLELEGIHCNMTLLFSLPQAVACAVSRVTLVSPFVGRILDWYQQHEPQTVTASGQDPGVASVREIYHYYKHFGFETQVMGASFRNREEITSLAGCDLLTIAPKFLEALRSSTDPLPRQLSPQRNPSDPLIRELLVDEKQFRWELCRNAMASDKLYEGIRNFARDTQKLEALLESRL